MLESSEPTRDQKVPAGPGNSARHALISVQDLCFSCCYPLLPVGLLVPFPHTVALPCLQIDNVAVICQRAQEHIHAGECILTYGYSKIVEQFLKAAGAKRKFQVL
jgi:hypothetical protein